MKNCKSFRIWTEDRYGVKFFDNLLRRIERELEIRISPHKDIKSTMGAGGIDSKIVKLATAGWMRYDCIIFIRDGDRKRDNIHKDLKQKIEKIPDKQRKKNKQIILIVLNNKIELDWVEKGIGKKLPGDYDKAELPTYADKMDLNFLREDNNFKEFISAVDPWSLTMDFHLHK